jgi:hypothetical protein
VNSFLEDLVDWDCANRILANLRSVEAVQAVRPVASAEPARLAP